MNTECKETKTKMQDSSEKIEESENKERWRNQVYTVA